MSKRKLCQINVCQKQKWVIQFFNTKVQPIDVHRRLAAKQWVSGQSTDGLVNFRKVAVTRGTKPHSCRPNIATNQENEGQLDQLTKYRVFGKTLRTFLIIASSNNSTHSVYFKRATDSGV